MSAPDVPGRHGDRSTAAALVRAAIERAAVQAFGATVREEAVEAFAGLTRTVLDDALGGVRAARLALDVANGRLREYALEARAAGRAWDEVAAALDLPSDTADPAEVDGAEVPRAERAFEWLIEGRAPVRGRERFGWRPTATWTCGSCRARVVDRGPFEFHPDDREQGHVPGCTHRAVALRRWRQAQGEHHEAVADEQDEDDGGGARR